MYRSINKYVRGCLQRNAKKRRPSAPAGLLRSLSPSDYSFQRVGIDFLGPFPVSKTKHRWIIVAVDHLKRYAETFAVTNSSAADVADFFLHQILLRHGGPQVIISDPGRPLVSKLLEELIRATSTPNNCTSTYHPQTNGPTEWFNHTLATMVSIYVSDDHTT